MQQEIQLNIIPFTAPVGEADFAFCMAKQDACLQVRKGYCPKYINDLNEAIEGFIEPQKPKLNNRLIYLIYHFNRIYWKSESHQNLRFTSNPRNGGQDIPILHPRQTT